MEKFFCRIDWASFDFCEGGKFYFLQFKGWHSKVEGPGPTSCKSLVPANPPSIYLYIGLRYNLPSSDQFLCKTRVKYNPPSWNVWKVFNDRLRQKHRHIVNNKNLTCIGSNRRTAGGTSAKSIIYRLGWMYFL